jgi:photoactive yellow protein
MIESVLGLVTFAEIRLVDLVTMTKVEVDSLPFGVVGLSSAGLVEVYNATESKLAGLSTDRVLGSHFFISTAQCMNNFMVAERLENESELDTVIDYVLTFRMRPTPVRIRLMKSPTVSRRYLLIQY